MEEHERREGAMYDAPSVEYYRRRELAERELAD
jgi:hypothetical protein